MHWHACCTALHHVPYKGHGKGSYNVEGTHTHIHTYTHTHTDTCFQCPYCWCVRVCVQVPHKKNGIALFERMCLAMEAFEVLVSMENIDEATAEELSKMVAIDKSVKGKGKGPKAVVKAEKAGKPSKKRAVTADEPLFSTKRAPAAAPRPRSPRQKENINRQRVSIKQETVEESLQQRHRSHRIAQRAQAQGTDLQGLQGLTVETFNFDVQPKIHAFVPSFTAPAPAPAPGTDTENKDHDMIMMVSTEPAPVPAPVPEVDAEAALFSLGGGASPVHEMSYGFDLPCPIDISLAPAAEPLALALALALGEDDAEKFFSNGPCSPLKMSSSDDLMLSRFESFQPCFQEYSSYASLPMPAYAPMDTNDGFALAF